jgi:hypothetical protein
MCRLNSGECVTGIGHNRTYEPYMTVYLVISLPKTPCIHRIYIYQGCVIRSFETFNTVKYALNTEYEHNTIVSLSNFESADF